MILKLRRLTLSQELNNMNRYNDTEYDYIKDIITTASRYLNNQLSDLDLILTMNNLCSIAITDKGNSDRDLLAFKAIWSEMTDIEDEIKEGKATQEDVKDYIVSERELMKEACLELIKRYDDSLT
jgi:hypothetical protein